MRVYRDRLDIFGVDKQAFRDRLSHGLGAIAGRPAIAMRLRSEAPLGPREVFVVARSAVGGLLLFRGRNGVWKGPQSFDECVTGTPAIAARGSSDLRIAYLGTDGEIHFLAIE